MRWGKMSQWEGGLLYEANRRALGTRDIVIVNRTTQNLS